MKYKPKTKQVDKELKYDFLQKGMSISSLPSEQILTTADRVLFEYGTKAYNDFINGACVGKLLLEENITISDSVETTRRIM